MDYDTLQQTELPEKQLLISVVLSNKTITRGQVLRRRLIDRLQRELGDAVHVFGRGYRSIGDKWEALAPYCYHLAMENSRHPFYWTEKLADPFLAGCLPLYWGAPNASAFFPSEAFIPIDIRQQDAVIQLLRRLTSANEWKKRRAAIGEARRLVLGEYNFFNSAARLCTQFAVGSKHSVRIKPEAMCQTSVQRKLRAAVNTAIARTGLLDSDWHLRRLDENETLS